MCLGASAHASKGLERFCKVYCRSKDLSVVSALLLGANGGSTALWPRSLSRALAFHLEKLPPLLSVNPEAWAGLFGRCR